MCETEFNQLFAEVKATASKIGVQVNLPRIATKHMYSQDMQVEDLQTFYRQIVFIAILESMMEISPRFSKETFSVYDLNVCVPRILVTYLIEGNDAQIERLAGRYHCILE